MKKNAFSMIELIVVLAILAILVVAMWILIQPLEQVAKASDGAKVNNSKELAGAISRYATSFEGDYPWNKITGGPRKPDNRYNSEEIGMTDWIQVLIDANEVKQSAAKKLLSGDYVVVKDIGLSPVYVCTAPRSNSAKLQAAEKCKDANNPRVVAGFQICATVDGSVPGKTARPNYTCVTE